MKRILFVLVALFTLIGHSSNSQTINIDIASVSGAVGDVVSVPIYIQLPTGSQLVDQHQGAFELTDPSVAEIIGVTSTIGSFGQFPHKVTFAFTSLQASAFNGVYATLDVKINQEGCTDIIFADLSNPFGPLEFEIDGVLFDDLATDFNVTDGKVCGDPLPPCDPNDLTLWPIIITQGTINDCSAYTISVDPVVDCNGALLNGLYSFVVVDFVGNTIAQVNNTQSTSITVNLPYQIQYFVVVQFDYVDVNGDTQTISQPASFFYAGCTTPCDPNDLTLGPIGIAEGTSYDCSDYTISVPPISGCGSTILNGAYTFTVISGTNGSTVAFVENTQSTSIPVSLTFQDLYIVHVQYTYFDINGVSQTVTETTSFYYAGCGCHLPPPANLDCELNLDLNGYTQTLSWDPVPTAISYEIEYYYNDPACCAGVIGYSGKEIMNVGTATSVVRPANFNCFSWKVRAICSIGEPSDWSSSVCSCGPVSSIGPGKSALTTDNEGVSEESFQMTAVPNPASNQVNIMLSGWSNEIMINQPEIIIYEISGKVVYQSEITLDETKSVDVSSLSSGVYIINIIDNNVLLSTEKLIIE